MVEFEATIGNVEIRNRRAGKHSSRRVIRIMMEADYLEALAPSIVDLAHRETVVNVSRKAFGLFEMGDEQNEEAAAGADQAGE